ncbi:MAG: 4-(cytidine 5'-diphospho)-2-C-methyl-D-erythritol kinase [Chloroflexi bacterium]|nr:4-(cytidine 5'-diphospho)-2-C-methyl-D-erythritol kinase [Chloroflexota bacterium]|tara:strand:+ start:29124 stop:29951 length:828 start_codon:yes stop_codon:yes gene_type:complete
MLINEISSAKVNLGLEVLHKRPDSYHQILSVLLKINLNDYISIEESKENQILQNGIEENDNIIRKVVSFMQNQYRNEPIRIEVKKNIPYSSGLGGGSSNAAAVIKGINKLWKLKLKTEEMKKIAIYFGSDVPFFISHNTAIVEGKGEKIHEIPRPSFKQILLICPNVYLDQKTKQIYDNVLSYTDGSRTLKTISMIKEKKQISYNLFNGLESSALEMFPTLKSFKNILNNLKLNSLNLTGAGPTYYSIFNDNSATFWKNKIESKLKAKCIIVDNL